MTKWIKIVLLVAAAGLVAYKSVYVKKLSEVLNSGAKKFDAAAYTEKLWKEQMPQKIDSAIALQTLVSLIAEDRAAALSKYSSLLGIGNNRYALISTEAYVNKIEEDQVLVNIPFKDSSIQAILATEFIYGNAIRDATKLIDLKDFPVSDDLNSISEEINKHIRTVIIPPFKSAVRKGDRIAVTAAIQLNTEHIKWSGIDSFPFAWQ